jgi:hypothetical protein
MVKIKLEIFVLRNMNLNDNHRKQSYITYLLFPCNLNIKRTGDAALPHVDTVQPAAGQAVQNRQISPVGFQP